MFWKLLVSLLILPSYLGFDLAAASINNGDQTLTKSLELGLPTEKTQVNQNLVNSSLFPVKEHSSIQGDQEVNIGEVKQTEYEHPYQIAHEYYYNHSGCKHHRYYHHRYYRPDYVDYRYHYHHEYYPSYYHNNRYYRNGYDYSNYHYRYNNNNGYYRNGYNYSNYHYRYNNNNGYYRHEDYYPRYYHQQYYRHGYDY